MAAIFFQDPVSTLDYNIDWTAWLNGDVISASTWTTHPDLTASSPSFSNSITTIFLAGGTAGKTYKVKNKITTSAGRVEEETFDFVVRTH